MTRSSEELRVLDELLKTSDVLVAVGTGGVGKTTTSAALGVRGATEHGRRVLVLTVDPARRLIDALGLGSEASGDEIGGGGALGAVQVDLGEEAGELWVKMVDMSQSWDHLVRQCAPTERVADDLLGNSLYRSLTTNFIASHDYIALDQLYDLRSNGYYDLVIVDTPPSAHVLDLIDAPLRMAEFLESRLLDVLTGGALGRGIGSLASKPFLSIARRMLGSDFLTQISSFFLLLRKLAPAFRKRSAAVQEILAAPDTKWVGVTTAIVESGEEYQRLVDGLSQRSLNLDLVVLNRSLRATIAPEGNLDGLFGSIESEVADPSLERAMAQWANAARSEPRGLSKRSDRSESTGGVVAVGLKAGGVDGVDDLGLFFD